MRIRPLITLMVLGGWVMTAFAQTIPSAHVWVLLPPDPAAQSAVSRSPADLGISDRAMHRRAKVLPPDRLIDNADLPIPAEILDRIRATGVRIRTVSRWLHAVSVEATPDQQRLLPSAVAGVRLVPVAEFRRPAPLPSAAPLTGLAKSGGISSLRYGQSLTQVENIQVTKLHDLGIIGSGVLIGMLDDGFNYHRIHPALRGIQVLAEYDFVQGDSNTSIAPGEYYEQGDHGAGTLSEIGAFAPGTMVGAAPGAAFVLAKTEVDSVEIHAEEDNYVAALEWMERLGVDIASSSLGYRAFDASTYSYSYGQLDGHTTIVAQAAAIAARKGVLLSTAMGNEGYTYRDSTGLIVHAPGTIVSPADADSILGVGATTANAVLTGFSGTGPTADGRIKPDVVAQGAGIFWVDGATTDGYRYVQGTSCSTPLVAGAAALILSAHPELTPMQVRAALMNNALHVNDGTWQTEMYPNNFYGAGFIQTFAAALSAGPLIASQPVVMVRDGHYVLFTWMRSTVPLVPDSLAFEYTAPGQGFHRVPLEATTNPDEYRAVIPVQDIPPGAAGYFVLRDSSGARRTYPANAPDSLFAVQATPDSLLAKLPTPDMPILVPATYVLRQNFPNPFNGVTTIEFDVPQTELVELALFDLLGRRVRTLWNGPVVPPSKVLTWNGRDDGGHPVATGVYFYRLKTPTSTLTKKLLYLK